MTAMWGIHADAPRSAFLATGVIVLERGGIGDLHAIGEDRDAFRRRLGASHPDAKAEAVSVWASALMRFGFAAGVGDVVVHPERASGSISVGRIDSDYYFEEPDRHCRRVAWLVRRFPRADLSDVARREVSARAAFFAVRHSADEIYALLPQDDAQNQR